MTFTGTSGRRHADDEVERSGARLRRAIRDGALVLHYQPKIDLPTGRCDAVEALVRWQREDRLIYPDEFIAVAERCGVIGEVTDWVIDAAAGQISAWNAMGRDLRVAVNLSALSLTDDHIIRDLRDAAKNHRPPVSQFEVEITESGAAQIPEAVIAVLSQLRATNVRTAIDDFGTGYSSLSYLKHLPVSAIKIDKSFVMNMPQDPRDKAIVTSTVHMAHSLGLTVVAEGVEDEHILGILLRTGCDTGQGYLLSRPVSAEHLTRWLHVSSHRLAHPRSARRPRVRHPDQDHGGHSPRSGNRTVRRGPIVVIRALRRASLSPGSRAAPATARGGATSTWSSTRSGGSAPG